MRGTYKRKLWVRDASFGNVDNTRGLEKLVSSENSKIWSASGLKMVAEKVVSNECFPP